MKFHMRLGTKRPVADQGEGFRDQNMKGYKMLHFKTSPKGKMMMGSAPGEEKKTVLYTADEWGNMEVDNVHHINGFASLGWPIYDGPGSGPVTRDQCIWPDKVTELVLENNPYERRILEEIKRRSPIG